MYPGVYNNLAVIYVNQKKYDEAIAYMTRAVRIGPDNPGFRINLARILLEAGRRDQALAQLQQVLQSNPGDPVAVDMMNQINSP